jgi:hypothetical protein
MFFIIFGIYGFFLVFAHEDVEISKNSAIFFGVILMFGNGVYANSNSKKFVKYFNAEKHKKRKTMLIGGFISVSSFLFMFTSASVFRKVHQGY